MFGATGECLTINITLPVLRYTSLNIFPVWQTNVRNRAENLNISLKQKYFRKVYKKQ